MGRQRRNSTYINNGKHLKGIRLERYQKIERHHEIYTHTHTPRRNEYKTKRLTCWEVEKEYVNERKNRINSRKNNNREYLRKISRKVDLSIDRLDLDRFESIFIAINMYICIVSIDFYPDFD